MNRLYKRRALIFLAMVALVLPLRAAAASATEATAGGRPYASGITILRSLPSTPRPLPTAAAMALDAAQRAASQNPDNLSFPWFDRTENQLVLTASTQSGHAAATTFAAGAASLRTVPHRTTAVAHSQRHLQRILDETIGFGSLAAVYADYPDPANNRVILETSNASEAFLSQLAGRYDPTAIAVFVDLHPQLPRPLSRNYDQSPFWGGAQISTPTEYCTSGLPWTDGSNYYMITAGHCATASGTVSTPAESMGWVNSYESSYASGVGSVQLAGVWRGDIALIRITSGKLSDPYMYTGGVNSSSYAKVKQIWSRSPQPGDQYCTGGMSTGELCGWNTEVVGGNMTYSTGEVVHHVSWGHRGLYSGGVSAGDSGGPVYNVRSDGGIAAKGVISAGADGNAFNGPENVYSDVWDAWYAYPGWLYTG